MVKYFTAMSGVVLVGDRPSWYRGEHIPYPDTLGRKEFSIYDKLMQVKGTVLYTNDDFFALKPFDEHLPNYYNGPCGGYSGKDPSYQRLYQKCPANWLDFDIHTPMIIDTTKFYWDTDRPIKTYYANQNKLPGTRLIDHKAKRASEIKGAIHAGRPFFSTWDRLATDATAIKILSELYPNVSPYEQ